MHNGSASLYTDIRMGKEQIRLVHPLYDEITAQTYNLIVYQEQILRIVTEIGLFDWTHAAYIRKIISRKIGEEEFNRQWGRFWEGAKKNGLTEAAAQEIWKNCITSGTYAFNLAHSVSYAMLSAWCMHFKAHYPQVFYAASLSNAPVGKKDRIMELMRDADAHGIEVKPPSIKRSSIGWRPSGQHSLRAGWDQVPGIGPKMAEQIVEANVKSISDLISVRGIGPKTITKLQEFVTAEDPFGIHELDRRIEWAKGQIKATSSMVLPRPTHRCEDVPHETTPYDVPVVVLAQVQVRNQRSIYEINPATQRATATPETARDPELFEWMIMRVVDGTETCSMAINRYQYPHVKDLIWSINLNEDMVLFKGVRRAKLGFRYVNVDRMWVIGSPNGSLGDDDDE
jgi:DNA polymerase-3 subunit alpha